MKLATAIMYTGTARITDVINLIEGFNYDFIGEIGYVAGWGVTDRRRHKSGRLKAAEMKVESHNILNK